MSRISFWIFCN